MRRLPARLAVILLALAPATAGAEVSVAKGPWLMDVTPTSVVVLVELEGTAEVKVTARAEDDAAKVVEARGSGGPLLEIPLDGLSPRTRYAYAVAVAGGARVEGHFETPPPPGEGPVGFVVYGDNRTDHEAHARVVSAILETDPTLVVSTGDLVFAGGRAEDWTRYFQIAAPLLRAAPFVPVAGNHELSGDPGARAYRRYVRTVGDPADTHLYYAFDYGPVRFLMLDSNDEWTRDSAQYRWAESRLREAREDRRVGHVFAVLHHGPYSSGRHGDNPRMAASAAGRMLAEGGVELVFSGHDHAYERGLVGSMGYVVTGGGGAPLYRENRRREGQLAFVPAHHFVQVRVEGPKVELTTVGADGGTIERCLFRRDDGFRCGEDGSPAGPVRGRSVALFAFERYGAVAIAVGVILVGLVVTVLRRRRSRRTAPPRR